MWFNPVCAVYWWWWWWWLFMVTWLLPPLKKGGRVVPIILARLIGRYFFPLSLDLLASGFYPVAIVLTSAFILHWFIYCLPALLSRDRCSTQHHDPDCHLFHRTKRWPQILWQKSLEDEHEDIPQLVLGYGHASLYDLGSLQCVQMWHALLCKPTWHF